MMSWFFVAVLLGSLGLLGCGDPPPTPEEIAAAQVDAAVALIGEDYAAGLAALQAIEDPVHLTRAAVEIIDTHSRRMTPEQGRAVCAAAASAMPTELCELRFNRAHLRDIQ